MKTLQIVVCKDYIDVLFLDEREGVHPESSLHKQFDSMDAMLDFFESESSELDLAKMELRAPRRSC